MNLHYSFRFDSKAKQGFGDSYLLNVDNLYPQGMKDIYDLKQRAVLQIEELYGKQDNLIIVLISWTRFYP